MKTIVVTGSTGLVGDCLLRLLVNEAVVIKALYTPRHPPVFLHPKISYIEGDVLDVVGMYELCKGAYWVFHCAAMVSFDPQQKEKMYQTNVVGTANIVNSCIENGVEKLCHVSSISAIQNSTHDAQKQLVEEFEFGKFKPTSYYGLTKYLSEMEVWRGIAEGLTAVIINPTIILSVGDWNKNSTRLFQSAYREFGWYPNGSTGFVAVEDVAQAMLLLIASTICNQRFILSENNYSYRSIQTYMARAFNKKPPTQKMAPWLSQIAWRLEKMKSLLTQKPPLLTRETVQNAHRTSLYSNGKFLKAFPSFRFCPIPKAIQNIAAELTKKYNLS